MTAVPFDVLAEVHRRSILDLLCESERSVGEAGRRARPEPAARVQAPAGAADALWPTARLGRPAPPVPAPCPEPLRAIDEWLEPYRRLWATPAWYALESGISMPCPATVTGRSARAIRRAIPWKCMSMTRPTDSSANPAAGGRSVLSAGWPTRGARCGARPTELPEHRDAWFPQRPSRPTVTGWPGARLRFCHATSCRRRTSAVSCSSTTRPGRSRCAGDGHPAVRAGARRRRHPAHPHRHHRGAGHGRADRGGLAHLPGHPGLRAGRRGAAVTGEERWRQVHPSYVGQYGPEPPRSAPRPGDTPCWTPSPEPGPGTRY